MEDGKYAAISGYLEHGTYPAVAIYEFYITKKLQKLQAVKRQAVLQAGTDSRWNRA